VWAGRVESETMPLECPRCRSWNPELARFCRNCGLALIAGAEGVLGAGRAPHPEPLTPPDGCQEIEAARDLYFRWHAVGGGVPLLGTEPLVVKVFNGGYDLRAVLLRISGTGSAGLVLLAAQREIEDWPRGATVALEIPSYELPDPVQTLTVELVQAEFGKPA